MKLYYAEVLNPRKVCAVAKYLDAPIDYAHVDLAKGEHLSKAFRAKNPNGKVPVLEDGERVIWEADAIICHLARKMGSDLWPTDERQVDVMRWLSWNQVHFQPHGGMIYFQTVINATFGTGEPDPQKIGAATTEFRRFARVLDAHLDGRETLVGTGLTIADFSVAGVLPFRDAAGISLDAFPHIAAWNARLERLPAWRDPYPETAS